MVFPPEPASPAAPCALHRCGFPVGTLMRLDVVPRLGALHIGNAPATATVSACKALTAGIILVLLSCDWSQPAVCELVPPHTAPPAHLGKPSSIFNPFFSSHSSPSATLADFVTTSRPENYLCICGYRTTFRTGLFLPTGASGWIWSSWHPPTPQTLPVSPLPPCTHPFPFLCMCTQHCTANLALHTTAHAVTSDLFVEFGTNGPHWVHWAPPRRDIHLSHPFPPLPYSSTSGAPLRACTSWPGSLTFDVELHHFHHHSTSSSILFYPLQRSSFHQFLSMSTSPHQAPPYSASHQSLAPASAPHSSQHQHSSLSMPGTPHTYSHLVMPSHAYYTSIC
mmetsp:Transcript_38249/g.86747  ORF Transcript_38249/g.86747 Transcript_38249/m.86747 type:complete len:337 (+) Transcript_38249:548-1558(+)